MADSSEKNDGISRASSSPAAAMLAIPETATLDRFAELVALTLGLPIAALGILSGERVHFKARIGLAVTEVSGPDAVFLTVRTPVMIPDTQSDPRSTDTVLVRQSPHMRFYAGVPLIGSDGRHMGVLCAMDTVPHPPPNAFQRASLNELATLAAAELDRYRSGEQRPASPSVAAPGEPREGAHRNLLAAYVAKSEFLASLSHELRTPLNSIMGYADLIASTGGRRGSSAEHATEIASAARHMLALVNDILEYSRLEAGSVPINWQRIDLKSIVDESLHMVRVFATSRGVNLSSDISWPGATVRADPVRLKQVLLNLLTNGIKFTPRQGSVTVSLGATAEGLVELTVRDTGIGISQGDIPKTLTPFGQVVPKEGNSIEGTGLGLPIAKELVERLGGRMILESHLGQGTLVRVLLQPLTPPPESEDDEPPPQLPALDL